MSCPKCGYPMYCGCEACKPTTPPNVLTYEWTEDGECVVCGNCGFTAHIDWWYDYDYHFAIQTGRTDDVGRLPL